MGGDRDAIQQLELDIYNPAFPDNLGGLVKVKEAWPLTATERDRLLKAAYNTAKPLSYIGLVRCYREQQSQSVDSNEFLIAPETIAEFITSYHALMHGALLLYATSNIHLVMHNKISTGRNDQTFEETIRNKLSTDYMYRSYYTDIAQLLLNSILEHKEKIERIRNIRDSSTVITRDSNFYQNLAEIYLQSARQLQKLTQLVPIQQKTYFYNPAGQDKEKYEKVFSKNISYSLLPFDDFFRQEAQYLIQQGLEQLLNSLITSSARRSYFINLLHNPLLYLSPSPNPESQEKTKAILQDYVTLYFLLNYALKQKINEPSFITVEIQQLSEMLTIRHLIEKEACFESSWKGDMPVQPFAHYELLYLSWQAINSLEIFKEDDVFETLIKHLNEPNKDIPTILKQIKLFDRTREAAESIYQHLSNKHPLKANFTALNAAEKSSPSLAMQLLSWWKEPTPALNSIERSYAAYKVKLIQWNLPRELFYYVERSLLYEKIELLYGNRKNDRTLILATLTGLGGIGKTQIANHYIHLAKNYTFKAWFQADSITTLHEEYRLLARELNLIREQHTLDQVVARLRNWLHENPGWLLVYDNVNNPNDIYDLLPEKGGCVLITSRNSNGWQPEEQIKVSTMSSEEAKTLMKTLCGEEGESTNELLVKLGHFPLAITQAASYIKKLGLSSEHYLNLYKQQKLLLIDKSKLPQEDNHLSLMTTWELINFSLLKENPGALEILKYCALLAPNNIPVDLLIDLLKEEGRREGEKLWHEYIESLLNYSLITLSEDKKTISIHPLLTELLLMKMENGKTVLFHVLRLLPVLLLASQEHATSMEDMYRRQKLLPHLLATLSILNNLSTKNPDESKLKQAQANILTQAAIINLLLGNYRSAKHQFEEDLLIK